jgi:CheY-like chemotaxis protein
MRLMIVDDNKLMRKTIIQMVTQKEDEFMECSSGEEAVANYSAFDPDWILMDIQMGEMNGFMAAERILLDNPKINIAFVTNHNTEIYRETARNIGIKHYFLKLNLFKVSEMLNLNKS